MKKESYFPFQDVKAFHKAKYIHEIIETTRNTSYKISESITFHASAVLTKRGVILFLGHSTAGKSTISDMLSTCFTKIEDDLTRIIINKDSWCVKSNELLARGRDTYWPVLAFVTISKKDFMSINSLSSVRLCKQLLDAYFEIDAQRYAVERKLNKEIFHTVSKMSKKISGWEFSFSLKSDVENFFHSNLHIF